jgi:CO dehydrogenase maturation factor
VTETIGNAREEMKKGVPTGMTKDVFMDAISYRLIANYSYMVIDNEAGVEHISRMTTNNSQKYVYKFNFFDKNCLTKDLF